MSEDNISTYKGYLHHFCLDFELGLLQGGDSGGISLLTMDRHTKRYFLGMTLSSLSVKLTISDCRLNGPRW